MSGESWPAREADKRARRGKDGHGPACQCLRCIGPSRFVEETRRLKAENDRNGAPAVPPGWHVVRRRLRIVDHE